MALTGAFFTALSGLNANAQNIDVIGNNIANVNTPGFKASRALFTTQFLTNFSSGSPPSATSGGTNPNQVGLGTRVAGTQVNFNNGGIQATGIGTNMAVEGNGFFIVEDGGSQFYTRDGQFTMNSRNELVTVAGAIVQGYGIDANFNVQPTVLQNVTIPLGLLTIAEATTGVTLAGNLNAGGNISTGGSQHASRAFYRDAGLTILADGTEDLVLGATDLYIDDGAGGSDLAFEAGNPTVITVRGVQKNGQAIPDKTFAFTDAAGAAILGVDDYGSTLLDFTAFLQDVLGLDSTSILGEDLGGSVTLAAGQIVITGNEGVAQDLDIASTNFIASNLVAGIAAPMVMTQNASADGESAQTSMIVYDSLGTAVSVTLTFVKQNVVAGGGTIWEWIAESDDNAALQRIVGLGILEFDAQGQFVSASNQSFSVDRANGAITPLTVNLDFTGGSSATTSFTSNPGGSTAILVEQDGFAIGTLDSFSVGDNGVITGNFTNGQSRTIGQIALASFLNNNGLVAIGNNLYASGPNSGNPIVGQPLQFGAGRVLAGSLEQSNVDLAEEFVRLITASTGFSAASRVITTSDEMIQQLLLIGR